MAKRLEIDRLLYAAVMLLLTFGLAMVYSASAALVRPGAGLLGNPFLLKQAIAAALGLGALFAMARTDYHVWRQRRVVQALFVGTLGLLVGTLFSPPLNGVRRWFFLGPLSFQPSEIAKLALVVFLAAQIHRHGEHIAELRPGEAPALSALLLPAGLGTGLAVILVVLEPDVGTALLLAFTAVILLFLAEVPGRLFALALASAPPVLWLLVVGVPYRRERLFAFLDPERDPLGSGYQSLQSLIAVGSGGILGLGPGRSVQKYLFLPHAESDFLFAIVSEELGLVGALAVLALYLVVLWRGLRTGWYAPDRFGRFLAWGLTITLVIQAFMHVSVNLAVLPTVGMPLPLLSYGGSSLVVSLTSCGILLSVSRHG